MGTTSGEPIMIELYNDARKAGSVASVPADILPKYPCNVIPANIAIEFDLHGPCLMSKPPPFAVALQYDKSAVPVPRVIAKGRGDVGAAILALAREHGVPIEENAALAEALSQVELGEDIPEALYRAVAEVLIFILRASGRTSS